jgi:hypothetical protein
MSLSQIGQFAQPPHCEACLGLSEIGLRIRLLDFATHKTDDIEKVDVELTSR